jgi:2TM domain
VSFQPPISANPHEDITMTDDELQRLARKRVAQKTGFAIHLLVYVLVNGGLALLSLWRGGGWGSWH